MDNNPITYKYCAIKWCWNYLPLMLLRYLQYQSCALPCNSCLGLIQHWLTLPVPAVPLFSGSCIASCRAGHGWCTPSLLGERGEGKGWRWAAPSLAALQQAACLSFPCSQDKLLPMWCPQGSAGKDPGNANAAFFHPSQLSKASQKIGLSPETLWWLGNREQGGRVKHLCLPSQPPGNLSDPCPASLIWYLAISWDFICYHYYQELKRQCPYLLWRNAVLFCYAKVIEISRGIQLKLSFYFIPCIWKRLLGQKSFLGTGHCSMSGNFWKKKEIACNGLWLPPLPGCSEWVNQVKLQRYFQTPLSMIFPTWGKPVCHI